MVGVALSPPSLNLQSFSLQSVEKELRALRHSVGKWPRFFNVVNGLEKEPGGCIAAVSDSRKGGEPAGY